MTDIFDAKILCSACGVAMEKTIVDIQGFELRAVKCPKCGDKIIHPADLNGIEHYKNLRDKKFNVKLRMVGNSHAISIPKEIIDFMNERHREMRRNVDEMVSLCFDDFDTLRLRFFDDGFDNIDDDGARKIVREDGKGNYDVTEEKSFNDERGFGKMRVRRIRRIHNGKE